MVIHMKTTFNIDDALMQQLRVEAARRGVTMTYLVETGIRSVLNHGIVHDRSRTTPFRLRSYPMGIKVDVANRDELYRVMEEE